MTDRNEECRALYRLIEGHCDLLLGCKSAATAKVSASTLRARAQEIKDGKLTGQLPLPATPDPRD